MPIVPPPTAKTTVRSGTMRPFRAPSRRTSARTPARMDARGVEDAERAADDEDVEDDPGDLEQAAREGQEDLAEAGRPGFDAVVGKGRDDLPSVLDDAVVAAGRDDPGRRGGQGDEADEQDVGVRDAELHRLSAPS
ncbi:MAG: hypothetical protein MZV64_50215 [Ignavibacteriales bacterium]|nr:hypothetical protein [Ignavibacteriales bacterium]